MNDMVNGLQFVAIHFSQVFSPHHRDLRNVARQCLVANLISSQTDAHIPTVEVVHDK